MSDTNHPSELRKVLIIDDNTAIHEDFRKILQGQLYWDTEVAVMERVLWEDGPGPRSAPEFQLDFASQGREGLAKLEEAVESGHPHIMAFVDVRMPPGWDGIETIQHLWQAYADLQVVVCTAYSDYSWVEMIRRLPKPDQLLLLKKPFEAIEVQQLTQALTVKWRLTQESRSQMDQLHERVAQRTRELQAANARLKAENETRVMAEERFAKAFRCSPIPITIQSVREGRYVAVNDSFLELTRCKESEVVGRRMEELGLWPDGTVPLLLPGVLDGGRPVRHHACKLRSSDGVIHEVLLSADRLNLEQMPHILVTFVDITGRVTMERELRKTEGLKAGAQTATRVAQGLGNLLSIIQGHGQLLSGAEGLPRPQADSVHAISQAAGRAADLTRLLQISLQKQRVPSVPLNLNRLIEGLRDMINRLLGGGIHLEMQLADQLPCVLGNRADIEHLLLNLVVNARNAMTLEGRVILRTTMVEIQEGLKRQNPEACVGQYVCLSVTDSGCGVAPEHLDRIFEAFFTVRERSQGVGLGLTKVRELVQQHQGWIEVESRVGEGSTFKVYFPWTDLTEKPSLGTSLLFKPASAKDAGETILVVEDDPALRHLVHHVLTRKGYRVLEAGDGAEALKIWSEKEGEVDLLLTNMMMPDGLSGTSLARQLKTTKVPFKVVFTSGLNQELVGKRAPQPEGLNVLPKPFAPDDLLRTVEDCLRSTNGSTNGHLLRNSGAPPKKHDPARLESEL